MSKSTASPWTFTAKASQKYRKSNQILAKGLPKASQNAPKMLPNGPPAAPLEQICKNVPNSIDVYAILETTLEPNGLTLAHFSDKNRILKTYAILKRVFIAF